MDTDGQMDAVTDSEIAERATYELDLPIREDEKRFARRTIRDGPVRWSGSNRPFPEDQLFVYDGAVWELSAEVVESTPARAFRLTLSPIEENGGHSETAADDTVSYSSLSEADVENLERYGWHNGGPFVVANVVVTYPDGEVEDSALVPHPEAPILTWESGESAHISVREVDSTEINTYEYTAHQAHESAAVYGRSVREEAAFTLDGLTAQQEDIVAEAIETEKGYRVREGDPPAAAKDLVRRFGRHEEVGNTVSDDGDDSSVAGEYLVRYDGAIYWTLIRVPRDVDCV